MSWLCLLGRILQGRLPKTFFSRGTLWFSVAWNAEEATERKSPVTLLLKHIGKDSPNNSDQGAYEPFPDKL